MDADHKKLVEEALKSDYFDKSLDIQIQKKAFEIFKRYKWIGAALGLFIFAVNAYLGFELKDFYASKLELQRAAKDLELESSFLQKYNQIMVDKSNIQEAQAKETAQRQEERIGEVAERADNSIDRSESFVDDMTQQTESFNSQFNTLKKEVEDKIGQLEEEYGRWQSKSLEIVRNSSTIFAYVERGGKEGHWDYYPKTFNLPYSSKRIKLIFKEVGTIDSLMANGEKNKYKKAMIIMQVSDSSGAPLFDGAQYLTEHNPKDIPKTDHQITLQYAYTPPNIKGLVIPPVKVIPDFAILAISLKSPDVFLNAPGKLATEN